MTGCCVPGCKSRSENGFILFSVPKDPNKRQAWFEKLNFKDYGCVRSRVCEKHFAREQFIANGKGRNKLKYDAIPTIFNKTPGAETTNVLKSTELESVATTAGQIEIHSISANNSLSLQHQPDYKQKYQSLLGKYIKLKKSNKKLTELLHKANTKLRHLKTNMKSMLTDNQLETLANRKKSSENVRMKHWNDHLDCVFHVEPVVIMI